MQTRDVVIVGGGPSGSTLAWALSASGLGVTIVDKRAFPRDKTCAGWVTPAVMASLAFDLDAYARDNVLQPIHGFEVSLMGAKAVRNDYGAEPVSYGIRRCEFDHYLLQRCRAEVVTGTPVKSIARDEEGLWCIDGRWRAKLLVGAGGHFCPVARALGASLGHQELVVAAQEIEFPMSGSQSAACTAEGAVPQIFFCDDLKGYGWVFRKGNYLNVGLGREDHHRLSEHVRAFCERLAAKGTVPADLPSRFSGHAYLLYEHAPRRVIGERALLLGDSAGLAYARSGEGIRPAVESALLAAEVIRASSGDYREGALRAYEHKLVERFGRRFSGAEAGPELPFGLKRALAGPLLGTHWFTRRFVTDRWFLHRQQPALVI